MTLFGRRADRRRLGSRKGTAALEFGLIGLPFMTLLLGIIQIGYLFYVQEMMDYATQAGARQIQIGAAQASGNPAAFVQQAMCNALATLMPCTGIVLSSQVVTDFYNVAEGQVPQNNGTFNSTALTFCPGQPGQLVLFQTYYPVIGILTGLLPVNTVVDNGSAANMIVSTQAFMNEQFSSTGAAPAGC